MFNVFHYSSDAPFINTTPPPFDKNNKKISEETHVRCRRSVVVDIIMYRTHTLAVSIIGSTITLLH